MKPKYFAIATGASLLAMTAGTPAKAINYYLSGQDSYSCNGGVTTCTITYNNFGISYDGSTWTNLATGAPGNILFTNSLNSDNIDFLQGFTTITNSGVDDAIIFSAGSNSFQLSLTPPGVDGTTGGGAGATTNSLITTTFVSSTLTPQNFNQPLVGTGRILGVPFSASALALLPLGMFSKRVKRRVLSA